MRVIITGGTGQIGQALSRELIDAGYEVIVLSRNPAAATSTGLPAEAQVVGWDARTADGWNELVDGQTAIVNLAGANLAGGGFLPSRWTAKRKGVLIHSRLDAGRAVVDAVERAKVKPQVVIQASGIGHYGSRGDAAVTETDAAGNDFLARLTVDWEASTAGVTDLGVRHVVIRSGVVLDPHAGALRRLLLPYRLFVGGPMGSGRQWLSWIHPVDEVAAIRFLIEDQHAAGAFNLCAPGPVTNAQLGQAIGRVLGRPSWLRIPGFVLRLALGEVASTVLEGQRALPKRLLDAGFEFRFPDIANALSDLLGRS